MKAPNNLSELVHDLRNPLNTIALSVSLLDGSAGLSDEERKHVERIARAVAKIEAMVADLSASEEQQS